MTVNKKIPVSSRYRLVTLTLAIFCASLTPAAFAQEQTGVAASTATTALQEVIVTATRQEQSQSKVPISITALSQQDLDLLGAKQIDDVQRLTPGLNFERNSFGGLGNRSQISIRGIESQVGASTTGIYIDDTPIQTRNAGFTSTSVYPEVFDLSRIEVLRGPQGTLFGSGSEGGTVRFITPDPDLYKTSLYSRAEISDTKDGGWNYEAGGAVGGPIIPGQLAARGSVYYRSAAGWIDRVDPNTGEMRARESNSGQATVVHLALAWAPVDGLRITPSVYYQDLHSDGGDAYWPSLSNPDSGNYRSGNTLGSPSTDKFWLPALKVDYSFGGVELISNTSYLDRSAAAYPDYTQFVRAVTTGMPYPLIPGEASQGRFIDRQKGLTEEIRLQSANPSSRLNWVAGVFYNRTQQQDTEIISDPTFPQMVLDTYGIDYLAIFGTPLGRYDSVYTDEERTVDKQVAVFGQLDYGITERLKATVGLRYAKVDFSFNSTNEGPFAGNAANSGSERDHPTTPKFGLSYQVDDANLMYASAAKGFRPGGAQRVPPVSCANDLEALGLSNAPTTYKPDFVWSYEVGVKSRLMDDRLRVSSSLFWINWQDIQQQIYLPGCGQSLIGNLGKAASKGGDISVDAKVGDHWLLHASAGYTSSAFTETIKSGAALVAAKGDSTSTISPWTGNVYGQYGFVVASHKAFALLSYDFASRGPKPNTAVYGVDPDGFQRAATNIVTARAGMDFGNLTASLFINNVFNSNPTLSHIRDIPTSPLFTDATFRPRTMGLTVTYAY